MNKIPQRTCMGCNAKKDKKELIRIVKNKNNELLIDKSGKLDGRGTYICNNTECLEKSKKNKRIERALKMEISNEIYDELKKIINGGESIG